MSITPQLAMSIVPGSSSRHRPTLVKMTSMAPNWRGAPLGDRAGPSEAVKFAATVQTAR